MTLSFFSSFFNWSLNACTRWFDKLRIVIVRRREDERIATGVLTMVLPPLPNDRDGLLRYGLETILFPPALPPSAIKP